MKKSKIKIYVLEILLIVILFFTLLLLNKINYMYFSLILGLFALITKYALKKQKILSTNKKEVILMMVILAFIFLGFFYLLGAVRYDFYKSAYLFSFKTLYRFIIPLIIIVISTEFIRFRFLSQDAIIRVFKKEVNLSIILAFLSMLMIDIIIHIGIYDLTNYDDFLTVLGFVIFSSVSCNLLYNYISVRYGIIPTILYKVITLLYPYIIPIIPDIYIYFTSFLQMIYPYLIYILLERTFADNNFVMAHVDRRRNVIGITIMIVIMIAITMLISCQFKYGMLVVGSGSMKGTINIGDAVIYESYEDQSIKSGDIIVFDKNGIQLIHRVIKVRNVDNEIRYYTKGDANPVMDSGYIVSKDIIGVTKLRVVYIGFPTLWLRQLFS